MLDGGDDPSPRPGGSAIENIVRRFNFCEYLHTLRRDFDAGFVWMLFSAYFGVKGCLTTLVGRGQQPYYMRYVGTSSLDFQRLKTFADTPGALKPLLGALSDTLPIRGYYKLPYMYVATILGVAAMCLLTILQLGDEDYMEKLENASTLNASVESVNGETAKPIFAPILFFFVMMQLAVVDLLAEGRYASLMVQRPQSGPSLVSWVWGSFFIGTLVVSSFVGPVADNLHVRTIFAIGIPFAIQILVPMGLGWFGEQPLAERRCVAYDKRKLRSAPRMYIVAAVMAVGALTNNIVALFVDNSVANLFHGVAWGVVMCATGYWALPRTLAHANVYMFATQVLYFRISGPLDAWFQATPACVPDGPHFDLTYYYTITGIIGSIASLAGVTLFQVFFKDKTFRYAFWMTTVLKVVGSVFDVIMVTRAHRPAIDDKVMYIFGDAIIGEIIGQLDFMPSVVLVSKVCPPGYESLVYALLAGFQNFGGQVASYAGACLTELWGIEFKPMLDPPHCVTDGLWSLIVVSHMAVPLLTIPLTFYLLPDSKLNEDILEQYNDGEIELLEPDWLENANKTGFDASSNPLEASLLDSPESSPDNSQAPSPKSRASTARPNDSLARRSNQNPSRLTELSHPFESYEVGKL